MTAVSVTAALIWAAVFWSLSRGRILNWRLVLAGIGASFGAVITIAAQRLQVTTGYPSDSFWTLGLGGRAGVIAISLTGIIAMFCLLAVKTQFILRVKRQISGTAWALFDCAAGLLIFGVIHTVSPQIFYSFYRLVFTGLPTQWVIDGLFDATRLQIIAGLSVEGSLADHLAGVTLWAIIPFTLWLHLHHWWRT